MGHANRSRLDYIVCMDTQPRGVRLSLAGRRRQSHSNTYRDTNANSHGNGNSDSNSNSYCYCYCYSNSNSWSQVNSHPEAAPHATAATVRP